MFSNKFYLNPNKNYSPSTIGQYKGKIVIVDALNRIYKQTIGLLQQTEYDEVLHIESIFRFATGLIKFGMLPIFVFDGKSPKEKASAIAQRVNNRKIFKLKCNEIDDPTSEEYTKYYKKTYHLTKAKLDECKKVLDLLGICYVDSLEEADVQCASLAQHLSEHIGGVITDDHDVLMYGAPIILKDFSFNNSKTLEIEKDYMLEYLYDKANSIRLNENKKPLNNFTHADFVRFSVLNGTDYSMDQDKPFKVDGVTTEKLFELFALNDLSMDGVANDLVDMGIVSSKETFLLSWTKITDIYLNSKTINPKNIDIVLKNIDKNNLIKFLCEEKKINDQFVLAELNKIVQNYEVLKLIYGENKDNSNNFPSFKHYQWRYQTKIYLSRKLNESRTENFPTTDTPTIIRNSNENISKYKKNNENISGYKISRFGMNKPKNYMQALCDK
jgi:flap endonuclease-1